MTWFPQESTKMREKNLSWFYLLSYTFPVTAPFQECYTRGISIDSGSTHKFKRLYAQRMWMHQKKNQAKKVISGYGLQIIGCMQ